MAAADKTNRPWKIIDFAVRGDSKDNDKGNKIVKYQASGYTITCRLINPSRPDSEQREKINLNFYFDTF